MFCYQCQETSGGKGCTFRGVCGKSDVLAGLQDLLIYSLKGISLVVVKGGIFPSDIPAVNSALLSGLFMTITNANFDEDAIISGIQNIINLREELKSGIDVIPNLHDSAAFLAATKDEMIKKSRGASILRTKDIDIRSLRETIVYGLKGMAAYAEHAKNLGREDNTVYAFIYKALAATLDDSLSLDDYVALTLETGEYGVKAMALLDEANTSSFGNPEITSVDIGVRKNPAILISGHDLKDLQALLEQTKDQGVDIYTHGEMLPAHYYPAFKKYSHFAGNYGNAWWKQTTEFGSFRGPILFTTNCIVPPKSEEVRSRIFTTGSAGYPGCVHIEEDKNGNKDFSAVIALAKTLPPPEEIEKGSIVGGFAHNQVISLADTVVSKVKEGKIKKFFVMAGCDGRVKTREYYTNFAGSLPKDTVILTAGCAKYRYNKLGLGDIDGIPRVLDAGQCNDSYSLVLIALKLKEVFGVDDINDLPIAFNIAWYEQKAVIVLLALLYLGVKNIHLGPTLPAFLSPAVAELLVREFGIAGIGNVEDDISLFMNA